MRLRYENEWGEILKTENPFLFHYSTPTGGVAGRGTFAVFAFFSWWYLKVKPTLNDHLAFITIAIGVATSVFQPRGH